MNFVYLREINLKINYFCILFIFMIKNISHLYLIPNLIGDVEIDTVIPAVVREKVVEIKFFIVENVREARRYLKKLNPNINISDLHFYELNQHTDEVDILNYLDEARNGNDIGLISDAGIPCVADPGNIIVMMAHEMGIKVVPISGPSSIFMALMASGLNGQNFAFNGYLPIDNKERIAKLKLLELKSKKENQSQIFMDTPYRNNKMLEDIISTLNPTSYLCIAINISCSDEYICTKKIAEWKKIKIDLNKKPCIFII